eukprot:474526-Pelagomonas_calceolata.AAC.2
MTQPTPDACGDCTLCLMAPEFSPRGILCLPIDVFDACPLWITPQPCHKSFDLRLSRHAVPGFSLLRMPLSKKNS